MQIKDEAKRKRILAVATELFQTHGFYDVKLSEVAEKADVSKSSIYTYYVNKNDLFFCCLNDGVKEFQSSLEDIATNSSFNGGFEKAIVLSLDFFRKKGPLLAVILKNGPLSFKMSKAEYDNSMEVRKRSLMLYEKLFSKGIDEGILSGAFTTRHMAVTFQSIFSISSALLFHNERPFDYDDIYSVFMSVYRKQE